MVWRFCKHKFFQRKNLPFGGFFVIFSQLGTRMPQLPVYVYFIALSFLASLTLYSQKGAEFYLRLFPFFLLLSLVSETTAVYLMVHRLPNAPLYNFFTVIEFSFYFFCLSNIIRNARVRRILLRTIFVYAVLALTNIFFIQKLRTFHSITYSIGSLVLVIFCIYYFYELFREPKAVNLMSEPPFWICSGLLFFYCCSFPVVGPLNLLRTIPAVTIQTFDSIITLLNVFLYSMFTVAFLCRIKIRKYIL